MHTRPKGASPSLTLTEGGGYSRWGRQGVVGVSPKATEPPRERAVPPSAAIPLERGHPALVQIVAKTSISHPAHLPFSCVFLPFGRAHSYLIFGIVPGPLM